MYIFTVCYAGGNMFSKVVDKENAISMYEFMEMGDFDNVAWFGYKPAKEEP